MELTETSLDYNLHHNNLRCKFADSPILSVAINEQSKNVVLLVSTVSSLHWISFPHPDTMLSGMSTTKEHLYGNTGNGHFAGTTSTENNVFQLMSIFSNVVSDGQQLLSQGIFVIDSQISNPSKCFRS